VVVMVGNAIGGWVIYTAFCPTNNWPTGMFDISQ